MRSIVVDSDSPTFQIDVRNSAAQHAGAFQARPQGTGNVRRFQAARGNFNQHRRKQPRVGLANCGFSPATNGRRITLTKAQKGNPSVAEVIARSIVEEPSSSKNAKIWTMPRSTPRASPKATFPRVKHRKKLETIPQRRPIKARRAIDFIGIVPEYVEDFGLPIPDQWSVLR